MIPPLNSNILGSSYIQIFPLPNLWQKLQRVQSNSDWWEMPSCQAGPYLEICINAKIIAKSSTEDSVPLKS